MNESGISCLETYIHEFSFLDKDLFCPEIQMYNTFYPGKFWDRLKVIKGDIDTPFPFWSIVWPGGRALARFILDHREMFRGKKILDYACGSGIASFASFLAGGEVTGYDHDSGAVAISEKLNEINAAQVKFIKQDILNFDPPEDTDIIIAGDIFYNREFTDKIFPLLKKAAGNGILCIVGDPGRILLPESWTSLERYRVPVYPEIESVRFRDNEIIQILP